MAFKRTKSGLTKLAALASLLLPGCYVKNVTQINEVHPEQDPVTTMAASSNDGSKVAFKAPFGNDLEAMVHKNGQLVNVSMDPDNSDTPIAFAGNKLIVKSERIPNKEGVRVKIFDETENLAFQTREFTNIYNITPYCDNTKVLFYGYAWNQDTGIGTSQVYTHTIGTENIEQLFPDSQWSGFEGQVRDTIFFAVAEQYGMKSYALQSDPVTGNTITEIGGNLDFQGGSGNIALFEAWNGTQTELRVLDTTQLTADSKVIETPAGREYDWMPKLSETGDGLVVRFEELATGNDEFWWADPKEASIIPKLITKAQTTSGQNFKLDKMSRTGNHAAFKDSNNSKTFLYDAGDDDFYDPLADVVNLQQSRCIGFSLDGKAVLEYEVNGNWGLKVSLHDPVTRTNSDLGDNQETRYLHYWGSKVTSDGQYTAIPAYDTNTGLEVVILEDIFMGHREDVIRKEGMHISIAGVSEDSENLFLQEYNWDPELNRSKNLHAYHIPTGELQQITNNASRLVDWFEIRGMSKDESTHFIRERNRNGTSKYLKWKEGEPAAELLAYAK